VCCASEPNSDADLELMRRNDELHLALPFWAMDISHIPMARGFVYLTGAIDWHSRKVLAWRLSISVDGKGCWADNVYVERVWRSIKCDEVYLHAYETVSAAREGIDRYINFHNTHRPHSSHRARTPGGVYFASLPQPSAEAV